MTLFRDRYRIESARHAKHDYSRPGWYHVTVCVAGMRPDLGTIQSGQMRLSLIGRAAQDHLWQLPVHHDCVRLDEYSVMPNHIHVLLELTGTSSLNTRDSRNVQARDLGAIIGAYKAGVTRWCKQHKIDFAWQARFYDQILRSGPAIRAIQEYIRQNVANWPEDEFNPRGETANRPSLP